MESQVTSPVAGSFTSRSRSSTKLADDTSLTSFNPFSEEDEHDQSSYTLVTSLFSRVKNSLAAPLSSVAATTNSVPNSSGIATGPSGASEQRRPSYTAAQTQSSFSSKNSTAAERPNSFSNIHTAHPAPPLVSLTPAQSEVPTYSLEYDRSPSRSGLFFSPVYESPDSGVFGTTIPGFPIQDDARSIKTTTSLHRSGSVSKVIRRIRGEGTSQKWFDAMSFRFN